MKSSEVFHTIVLAFSSALYSASSNKYLYHQLLSCLAVTFKGPSQIKAKRKAFSSLTLFFFVWNLLLKCCEESKFVKLVTSKNLN